MKAVAVFPKTHEIKLIEEREPQIVHSSQVKLRMLEVGVCGTDKEICRFNYGSPPTGDDYLIIGHEGLGEVVEVGGDVGELKEGDLAVPMVRRPCLHPECLGCRSGRPDFCSTGDFKERGIKEGHGYLTEFVVDDERFMCAVPRELRGVAVLVEPLTIAEKSAQQVWQIQQRLPWFHPGTPVATRGLGRRAVVLGGGAVGLLGAMVFRTRGFDTYLHDRAAASSPKAQLVESTGAKFLSAQSGTEDGIQGLVGTADIVYEAIGDPDIAVDMLKLLSSNSIFVLTGLPSRKVALAIDEHWRLRDMVLKNQVLVGIVNAGLDSYAAAIHDLGLFLQSWPDQIRSLITGRYPIEAFHDSLLGDVGGIKEVLTMVT